MMELDGYHTLLIGLTQLSLGGYVLLLMEFRPPQRRWRRIWLSLIILVVASNMVAVLMFGFWDTYKDDRMAFLSVTLPYIVITMLCSRYRNLRSVFGIAIAVFIGLIGMVNGRLVELIFPGAEFLSLAVRIVSFLLLFLLLHQFSGAYQKMLQQLEWGWGFLNLIPIVTCMLVSFIFKNIFPVAPLYGLVVGYGLLAICGLTFYVMYLFFIWVKKNSDAQQYQILLEVQISALQNRIEAVQTAEEAIRIERHDLRHRFRTIAELIKQGNDQEALTFIGAAQAQLDEQKTVHWCRPVVLDAVFSSYFRQAQQQGIQVDAHISLPDTLPVEEAELAIVFANALENAIHACMLLPQERREIFCKVICYPNLMFEFSNPYTGTIQFDEAGLPVSSRLGHGFGSNSIATFCQKHNASYQYTADNGRFCLRVIL